MKYNNLACLLRLEAACKSDLKINYRDTPAFMGYLRLYVSGYTPEPVTNHDIMIVISKPTKILHLTLSSARMPVVYWQGTQPA